MSNEAGKGSRRRPGIIPPDAWNRIFHPDKCATCGELKAKCGCVVERREKGDPTDLIKTMQTFRAIHAARESFRVEAVGDVFGKVIGRELG